MEDLTPGRLLRLALWMVRGISSRSIRRLGETPAAFEAASHLDRVSLAERMDLGPAATRQLLEAPEGLLEWAEGAVADLVARGARFKLRGDAGAREFGSLADPPEVLFSRGALGGAGRRGDDGQPMGVSVVGSRRASPGALRLAHRLGYALAREGFSVVSGGAFGVDAAAHRGALDAGGHTLAILGSGVLLPLPVRNRRLFGEILEGGGGLASELPPWQSARPEFFPRRNRLIAALSRALVVVQASQGSGSLHTVDAATAMGVPVYVFVDDDARNAGCRTILKMGGHAVRSEEELFRKLRGVEATAVGEGGEGDRLLDALDGPPITVAEMAARLEMPPDRVARLLARLCAEGKAGFRGPGRFARLQPAPSGRERPSPAWSA